MRGSNPGAENGVVAARVGMTSTARRERPSPGRGGIDPAPRTDHLAGMARFVRRIPEGDNRERLVCADCDHIAYENPKVVVGSVVVADGAVLMCRRAIEPRTGYWTLPAGYLELGETVKEGARAEA